MKTTGSHVCLTCGTLATSGKISCCARGGTWHNKCGNHGDTAFAHTWSEGIRACESKLYICESASVLLCSQLYPFVPIELPPTIAAVRTTTATATTKMIAVSTFSSTTCLQCSTFSNSRKVSCCARGGSWFNECGDDGDTAFAHTWSEGIRTCRSKLLNDVSIPPLALPFIVFHSFLCILRAGEINGYYKCDHAGSENSDGDCAQECSYGCHYPCLNNLSKVQRLS